MSIQARRCTFDRILVDMNTQCDLLLPRGALPVTNRTEILPNIRKLMNWARIENIPVVSSLECHRLGEGSRGLPPYCIDRSPGQRKIPFTLMPRRVVVQGDNTLDLPHDPFRRVQQVILTKRTRDFLANPKADRLFQSMSVQHLVIFGVVAEHCVKTAVLGLLARQYRIAVVTDACGFWSADDSELAMRQMDAKGAVLVTADELISGAADERIRNSRPMMASVDEEETAEAVHVGANGNGNGAGNGQHVTAFRNNGSRRDLPGNGVAGKPSAGARSRDTAADRLRPEPQPRRKVASHPQTKPPTGLA